MTNKGFADNQKNIETPNGVSVAEKPLKTKQIRPQRVDINILKSKLQENESKEFNHEVPTGHNSFIYILKGELKIGDKNHAKTNDSNLILLERGNKLKIKALKKTEFLFIAGKPIGEPIARGGPFVMNTKAEILEAIQDYNNGTFAKY